MKKKEYIACLGKDLVFRDRKHVFKLVKKAKVRVMACAEGYAMVRYVGCMPFVVPVKDLKSVKMTA